MITLQEYRTERKEAISLIKGFWLAHNQYQQSNEEAARDLTVWTSEGHKFYFILSASEKVGFIHLGNRGGKIDWLEDFFVLPEHQRKGIGTQAIALIEKIVRTYSVSLYIEAAARNEAAIRLYRRLGFDCLNTITIRKDFPEYQYDVVRNEHIYGEEFEIRKSKI
ncbi:MAG: GNAT family N-acetyltransferase [Lachnospiraceae bacterium]|nr:GNAT family N-acetyltransferase [Lachnospiraceae bacterium]